MDLRTSGDRSLPSAVSKAPSNSGVDFWADFVNDKSSVNHSISPLQDSKKAGRVTCTRKNLMKQLLLKTTQSRPVSLARRCKDAVVLRSQGSATKKTKRRLFSVKNDFLHPSKLAFDRASPRYVSSAPRRPLNSPRVPGASAKFGEQSLKKIIHKRGSCKEQKINEKRSANQKESSSCLQSSLKGSATESSSQSYKPARTRRASARIAQFEQKRRKHISDRRKLRENLEPQSQARVDNTSPGENSLNLQTILQTLTPYVQRLVQEKYEELHATPNSARHRSVKEQIAYLEEKRWRYIQNRRKFLENSKNMKRKQGGYTQEDNAEGPTDHQVTPGLNVSSLSPIFTALKPPTFFEPDKSQDQIHNCYDPSNEGLTTPTCTNGIAPSPQTQEKNANVEIVLQTTPGLDVTHVSPIFTALQPPTIFEPDKNQDQIHNFYNPSNEGLTTPRNSNASSPQTPFSASKTVQTAVVDTAGLRDTTVLETPTTNGTFQRTTSPKSFNFKSPSANAIPRSVSNTCSCTPLLRRRLARRNRASLGSSSQSSKSDADSLCSLSSVDAPTQREAPALSLLNRSPPRATPWGSVRFLVNRARHRDGGKPAVTSERLFSSEDETDHEVVWARAAAKKFIGASEAGGSSADEDGAGVCSQQPAGKKDSGEGADVDRGRLGSAVDAGDEDTSTDSVDGNSSRHNKERGPVDNESESSFASGGHYDECIHGDGEEASDTDHLDERLGSAGGESTADGHGRCTDADHGNKNINVKTEAYHSASDSELDMPDTGIGLFARTEKKRLTKDKKHKKVVSVDRCSDDNNEDQNISVKTEAYHSAIEGELHMSDTDIGLTARTEKKSLPKDKKHKKVVSAIRCNDADYENQNITVKTETYDSAIDSELDMSDKGIGRLARTEKKSLPKVKKHKNKETNGPSTSDQVTSSVETQKHRRVASVTELKRKSKGSSKSDQVTSSVETKKHKKNKSGAKINKKSNDFSKKHKKVKSVAKRKKKSKRSLMPDPVSSSVELQERLAKRTEANRAICQSMVPTFPEEWEEPAMSPAFLHNHNQFLRTKFTSLLMSRAKGKKLTDKPAKRGISVTSKRAMIKEQKQKLKMLTDEVEADGWISYDILPQIYKDPNLKSFIKRIK